MKNVTNAVINENFEDFQVQDFQLKEFFEGKGATYTLLRSENRPMSIVNTSGDHVTGKALLLRKKSTLEIKFDSPHKRFSFWYVLSEHGFEVRLYDVNDREVKKDVHFEDNSEKHFDCRNDLAIAKIELKTIQDNVLIDNIYAGS
ncbi:hypothetical protein [Pseudomonas fluorescens]|uniref:hypothetical protein n=1 Tax=Pseudomonas fluorescens TaxID=294 RepID=UPI000F4714D6|nr:hypothetical protein [Pseudomonas fluorescens]RON87291.1 hypothetical protein BK668_17955 [Pseudomonas fluorescens]